MQVLTGPSARDGVTSSKQSNLGWVKKSGNSMGSDLACYFVQQRQLERRGHDQEHFAELLKAIDDVSHYCIVMFHT